MRLPDSASVFTAEVWVIIKALEQIKEYFASPDWDGDTKVCLFKYCQKDIVFCWVPSHTGIKGNEKADLAAKSSLDLPRAKVGVPYTDFKHLFSQYIFSTWSWTSLILSSQSWEIGSPPTGGAGRMKLSCVVPASVIHIWPIHISWGKIVHLCVSTVSVFWQFATFWWSAIILLEKGRIYLVEEMWWNHMCCF